MVGAVIDVLQTAGVAIGVIVGLGGLSATIWAVGRVKSVEASVEVLSTANEGLREANRDLRAIVEQSERDCARAIAKLEGQNQALLDGLGDKLARAIGVRLEKALELAAQRIVDGVAQRAEDRERRFKEARSDSAQGG